MQELLNEQPVGGANAELSQDEKRAYNEAISGILPLGFNHLDSMSDVVEIISRVNVHGIQDAPDLEESSLLMNIEDVFTFMQKLEEARRNDQPDQEILTHLLAKLENAQNFKLWLAVKSRISRSVLSALK